MTNHEGPKCRILTVSGSLREASSNTRLLRAAARLGLPNMDLIEYRGMGQLPHFNPDFDTDDPPSEVVALRRAIATADGLLISSPEYAHGVPGSLKNLLDWLVASTEFPGTAVALLHASTSGGEYSGVQLAETLRTMSARIVFNASLNGPTLRQSFDAFGSLTPGATLVTVRTALATLASSARTIA